MSRDMYIVLEFQRYCAVVLPRQKRIQTKLPKNCKINNNEERKKFYYEATSQLLILCIQFSVLQEGCPVKNFLCLIMKPSCKFCKVYNRIH